MRIIVIKKEPGFKCAKCQHEWVGRKNGEKPKSCPKCRSIRWNDKPNRWVKK